MVWCGWMAVLVILGSPVCAKHTTGDSQKLYHLLRRSHHTQGNHAESYDLREDSLPYSPHHRSNHQRKQRYPSNPANENPFDMPLPYSPSRKTHSPYNKPSKPHKRSDCDVAVSLKTSNKTHVHNFVEVEQLLCHYYGPWSKWRRCNKRCQQRRVRKCRVPEQCGRTKLKEHRTCRRKIGRCSSLVDLSRLNVGDFRRQNQQVERVLYDVLYSDWSPWGSCTRSCKQRRRRRCSVREVCQKNYVLESRRCSVPGSKCEKRSSRPGSSSQAGGGNSGTTTPLTPHGQGNEDSGQAKPTQDRENGDSSEEEEEDRGDNLMQAQQHCGRRPAASRGSYRVVGGQEAQPHSWPWQVAILTRWEEQYCGGTLIAPQWLLTAAHCVRKRGRRRRIVVRAGEHNLEEFEGSEQDVKPEREFPHPDFDYATITNDIALVRLKAPLENRTHPGYACLPEPGFAPDRHSLCYILGWGKRRNTHLFGAESLHEAQVPIVTHRRCQKVFDYYINSTQLCAGYRRGGTDACAGDSGGPLLCPRTTKEGHTRWYLVGITSYGEGCGRKGKYGIYTRVTSYLDWITDTILSY